MSNKNLPAVQALLRDPLRGTSAGGGEAQAWLPMYATAAVWLATGPSLPAARLLSMAVGASTVVALWALGRRWLGRPTALLAATLLSLSPYFLGFARTALTEGDAFCALPVLLALLAFDTYQRRRDGRALVLLSAALGLAASAKFFAGLLVPLLALCDLWATRGGAAGPETGAETAAGALLGWVSVPAGLVGLTALAAQGHQATLASLLWVASVLSLLALTAYVLTRGAVPWPPRWAWLAIALLAPTFCLAVFPAHVLQPGVLQQVLDRTHHWDGQPPLVFLGAHLRLYSGIVLLKLGLPLGLLSMAALGWASLRARRHPGLRVLVAVLGGYVAFLVTLPLGQTFYLMSIYPLLVLVLAGFLVEMTTALRYRGWLRRAWLGLVLGAHGWLLWGLVHVYPEFGWYGYETIGTRWLGEEARGYRQVIQVTTDGTEDAVRWSLTHMPAGARLVSVLSAYHVVEALVAGQPLPFVVLQRPGDPTGVCTGPPEEAAYVLVDLNTVLTEGLPWGDAGPWGSPVHTIWRGRGRYRMPVVQLYTLAHFLQACQRLGIVTAPKPPSPLPGRDP